MSFTPRALDRFQAKGPENAARVRRIVQLIAAAESRPTSFEGLRILDLGCGEGLFALEAASHGADVLAIDARPERMAIGEAIQREGLDRGAFAGAGRVRFVCADLLEHRFEDAGPFDVVLLLGLLYHLDARQLFPLMERVASSTRKTAIIETHLAPEASELVAGAQRHYRGWSYREHRPTDDRATRQGRLLASLSNETSFWLTEASLVELLEDLGFASVGRCSAPTNPAEADDRATFVARKQPAPEIRSFPWINTASRREVENRSASPRQTLFMPPVRGPMASAQLATVLCLGDWVRRHPDFTVGNRGGPIADQRLGIWRRADLDDYVGGLRRVPPILVVELGRDEETLRRRAELYLAAGTRTVWLVLVETAELAVVDPSGATRFAAAQALPQIAELPDLRPRAGELLLL